MITIQAAPLVAFQAQPAGAVTAMLAISMLRVWVRLSGFRVTGQACVEAAWVTVNALPAT